MYLRTTKEKLSNEFKIVYTCFLFGIIVVIFNAFSAKAAWLDNAWTYRKSLHINSSADGALTNYEKKITVNYGSGTDSGLNVYLDSKGKSDFGDVRFTNYDGDELDYYLAQKINGDKATFYVEIDSIPSSGGADIFIYYGNGAVATTSNGSATFDHFEDFESTPFDFDTAGAAGISVSQESGTVKEGSYSAINNGTQGYKTQMDNNAQYSPDDYIIEGWVRNISGGGTNENLGPGLLMCGAAGNANGYQVLLDQRSSVSPQIRENMDYTSRTDGSYQVTQNTWYLLSLYRDNGTAVKAELWREADLYTDTPISTTTRSSETSYSTGYHGLSTYNANHSLWDSVWIRNRTENEPTFGSWGDEEEYVLEDPFLAEIVSNNFKIKGDNLTVGAETGSSTNFSVTADMNPFSDKSFSSNFSLEIGYNPRIRANTPYSPVLSNPDNSYDRLTIAIDPSDNPTDTLYAAIISTDDFATFSFIQNDGTLGDTLGMEDYRTYTSWGDSEGSYILGLNSSTTYKVRVKALHGDFTDTMYGPASQASTTTEPYVNMSISHASLTLGTLNLNSISQSTSMTIIVNTNAYSGYQVYVSDQGDGNVGGLSNGAGSTILSADMTLTAGVAGYGAQANSATAVVNPKYDLFGNTIGGLSISNNPLFSNSFGVTGESATVLFKATMSPTTIAGEYSDIVYYTVTPNL